jgi:hypothetical protein
MTGVIRGIGIVPTREEAEISEDLHESLVLHGNLSYFPPGRRTAEAGATAPPSDRSAS